MSSCLEAPASGRRLDEEGEELIDDDEEEEEEEVEDEEEEEVEEEEDEEEGGDHLEVTVGRRSGRGLTLKTLLKERVLEPGEGNMTINYLGNKFKGDLLSDGRIRSQETGKIFGTPSAWAIYCKKIVNPDKKSGCGWASVRYRGKKLDTYKNNWYRQKRLEYEKEEEEMEEEESGCESEEASPQEQEIIEFDVLGSRNPNHDPSTMIELATFQNIGRMQPFNITMSSSAMAVIDVHAHLTTSEVVGYLAGQWDVNNHNLIVSHAFPVRCRLGDSEKGAAVEQELYAEMARLKLSLVGWYHTHPSAPPLPSLRDIDSQLDYEMKMKGYNDASYTPVLGIIVSPYQKSPVHDRGIPHPNGNATGFWVMPPPENKPLEYGRPMSMQFTVVQDAFIPKEALLHMSEVVKYYKDAPDVVELTDVFEEKFTYWHKLKNSLRNRVPKDHFQPLIDFLTKVIDKKLPEDDPPMPAAPPASTPSSSASTSTSSSLPASITTTHLPPSTSISLVESKESPMEGLSSTKDLESCVTNLLKATMGADIVSLSDSSSSSKEKPDHGTPIVCPSPGLTEDHSFSSRPKSAEGRTPPPKSYSPLFQLPLPPIFSLDSAKLPSKDKPPPLFPPVEDKRLMGDFLSGPPKARASPSTKMEDSESSSSKKDVADMAAPGAYLDLIASAAKEGSEGRGKKAPSLDDPKKEASKLGAMMDVPAWFAQAKLMQEAFSLPPHERENPYGGRAPSPKDVTPLFPPEFLSSHWNPAAALKGFHPSLTFPSDSKPTYHSDVPLLLKKQKQEACSSSSSSSPASSSHDHKDVASKNTSAEEAHREFRPPPDYKEATKELRERGREVRSFLEEKDFRGGADPKVFKEPRDLKVVESSETYLKEPREVKMAHCGRDAEESSRREFWEAKDPPLFDEKDPEELSRMFRDAKGLRDPLASEVPKDLREMKAVVGMREAKECARERREVLDLREVRVSRDGRLLPHRGEGALPGHGVREDARDMRKVAMDSAEGKSGRPAPDPAQGGPINFSEPGAAPPKDLAPFRPVTPMDMSTFKIKRDLLNPDIRHFIEPTGGAKRLPLTDPSPLGGSAEANRNVVDLSEGREANRSPKEGAMNLACGSGGGKDASVQREFKELLEGGYAAAPPRPDPKDVKTLEGREGVGGDMKEALLHSKALINLRDPKSLLETRDFRDLKERMDNAAKLERDEHPSFPLPPRQLFPADEEMPGMKDAPTPPLFMSSRRTPSVEEPMDFE